MLLKLSIFKVDNNLMLQLMIERPQTCKIHLIMNIVIVTFYYLCTWFEKHLKRFSISINEVIED